MDFLSHMHPTNDLRRPTRVSCGPILNFFPFFVANAWFLSLTLGGNSPYKYHIPYSQFLIINEAVQEEGKLQELQGRSLAPYSMFLFRV